jgi:hypothetical protein
MRGIRMNEPAQKIRVEMPSQTVDITFHRSYGSGRLNLTIMYIHPTTGEIVDFTRCPADTAFSDTYFDQEVESYVVQEAMAHLTDYKHLHDVVE